MLKKILCILIAILIFAVPLSVGATGVEQPIQYHVNVSATVDGATPTGGQFTVKVEKETFDDENDVYLAPVEVNSFILNAGNSFADRYSFSISLGERFAFTVSSQDSSIFVDNHTFYAVLYPEDGLVISYENEEGSEEVELPEGKTDYNLVFANTSAPKLIEVTVKAVEGKKVSKIYDGNNSASVPSEFLKLEGIGDGVDVGVEVTSAKFNDANVKKANAVIIDGFKLVGRDAAGFRIVTQKVQLPAEITPRVLTVTAVNTVMTLGEAEPELTYSLSGELLGDDKLIGDLARTPGNDVGTYVITMGTLTLSGNSENYDIIFKEGVFTVSNHSNNTVTDKESNVSISGFFDKSASFTVTPISATDSDYKILFDNAAWGKVVSAYNISFEDFDGDITVLFPVPAEYNGKEIAVYQLMSNGAVTCFKTTATDTVLLTTDECTQFMLVADKEATDEEDSKEKRSTVATVFIVLLIIIGVIVGLVLIIVALFFGMIFFNKTEELKSIIRGIKKLFRK